jgi:hypothetical protein
MPSCAECTTIVPTYSRCHFQPCTHVSGVLLKVPTVCTQASSTTLRLKKSMGAVMLTNVLIYVQDYYSTAKRPCTPSEQHAAFHLCSLLHIPMYGFCPYTDHQILLSTYMISYTEVISGVRSHMAYPRSKVANPFCTPQFTVIK